MFSYLQLDLEKKKNYFSADLDFEVKDFRFDLRHDDSHDLSVFILCCQFSLLYLLVSLVWLFD